jgi:hypothetical protein
MEITDSPIEIPDFPMEIPNYYRVILDFHRVILDFHREICPVKSVFILKMSVLKKRRFSCCVRKRRFPAGSKRNICPSPRPL